MTWCFLGAVILCVLVMVSCVVASVRDDARLRRRMNLRHEHSGAAECSIPMRDSVWLGCSRPTNQGRAGARGVLLQAIARGEVLR